MILIPTGFFISQSLPKKDLFNFLIIIIVGHLIVSLLFAFDILQNPIYDKAYFNYSENMVITIGNFRAFTGLTLSKFELAYQVGFITIGALLFSNYSNSRLLFCSPFVFTLLLFTYNKTTWFVVTNALLVKLWNVGKGSFRPVLKGLAGILFITIAYFSFMFLQGNLNLRTFYTFLSPRSFWSRIYLWQDLFHFDIENIFQGFGAGYFEFGEKIIDNQFLYTYLELGLIPSLVYFIILVYTCYLFSKNKKASVYFMSLWGMTLLLGDMLGNVHIPFIAGLWGGASFQDDPQQTNPPESKSGFKITI